MAGLKYVTFTQLFWDTLEKHRDHPRYQDMRAKIAFAVRRKQENRNFSNNSDTQFGSHNPYLAGIWHCKLSSTPDVVMFYTVDGDVLNLAMLGSHHDYPFAGKGVSRSSTLSKKIYAAIDRGDVQTPSWRAIRWSKPEDILSNHELDETTTEELAVIMDRLELELYDAPIFKSIYGAELIEQDEDVIAGWLATTDQALEAVKLAQTRVRALRHAESPREAVSFGLGSRR